MKNSILENAGQHYALCLANLGYNDPQTIRARSYVNTSFGMDGHLMLQAFEKFWQDNQNTGGKKEVGKLKSFVHPLKLQKQGERRPADTPVNTSGQNQEPEANTGDITQAGGVVAGNFSELENLKFYRNDLLLKLEAKESSEEELNALKSEYDMVTEKIEAIEKELMEAEKTAPPPITYTPLTEAEKAEIIANNMKGAGVRDQFGFDRIEATIHAMNIKVAAGLNEKQICSALIQHLKKTK